MSKSTEIVVGFNGGEVSPNMESRPELDFYSRSASIIENADILPEGGSKNVLAPNLYPIAKHLRRPVT